jgi:hypothetical protein
MMLGSSSPISTDGLCLIHVSTWSSQRPLSTGSTPVRGSRDVWTPCTLAESWRSLKRTGAFAMLTIRSSRKASLATRDGIRPTTRRSDLARSMTSRTNAPIFRSQGSSPRSPIGATYATVGTPLPNTPTYSGRSRTYLLWMSTDGTASSLAWSDSSSPPSGGAFCDTTSTTCGSVGPQPRPTTPEQHDPFELPPGLVADRRTLR